MVVDTTYKLDLAPINKALFCYYSTDGLYTIIKYGLTFILYTDYMGSWLFFFGFFLSRLFLFALLPSTFCSINSRQQIVVIYHLLQWNSLVFCYFSIADFHPGNIHIYLRAYYFATFFFFITSHKILLVDIKSFSQLL